MRSAYEIAFDEFVSITTGNIRTEKGGVGRRVVLRTPQDRERAREKIRDLRVRMAGETAKRVDEFVRAPVMDKPEYLPSFAQIRKTLDKSRASRREPGQQAKELIRDYNLWLDQALAAEGRDVGTVAMLLDTIEVLEDAEKGHPLARHIEAHIRKEFEFDLPHVEDWPAREETAAREKFVRSIAHRESVIPMWLMDGLSMPRELEDDDDEDEEDEDDVDGFARRTGSLDFQD